MSGKIVRLMGFAVILLLGHFVAAPSARAQSDAPQPKHRNIIIFVADGLRPASVNPEDTPALWSIRKQGVDFQNSHSLFPTFTTANASAIATGHGLGDTGDFSNTVWIGYPKFDKHNFGLPLGPPVTFLEDDQVLGDLNDHYGGNYLGEKTLAALAREHGYNTAAVGKTGAAAIQDVAAITPAQRRFPAAPPIIVDDSTGSSAGIPLPPELIARLMRANLSLAAPARTNGYAPDSPYSNGNGAGTLRANDVQQQWFANVTTKAILPFFEEDTVRPFFLVFWSRDPDGTQHNQGDSLGALYPGINGETSRMGVQNADHSLRQLMDWLDAHPEVKANTDIFVTSDHGFATVSRREIDRFGHPTNSESAQHFYLDATGRVQTPKGTLPNGFLAIDLSVGLHTNLYDPDTISAVGARLPYKQVRLDFDSWEHPAAGNGFLGTEVERLDGSDASAIIAANGGSDLIYVPNGDAGMVRSITHLLLTFDYVGGVFVDQRYGEIPGALSLKSIGLEGTSAIPRPAIVVAFKAFNRVPGDLQTAVQISDTAFQEGQGMHGGFGRDSTFNNMAAWGPDFKKGFADSLPVSNADIAPTLAHLMGADLEPKSPLQGRMIKEALQNEPDPQAAARKYLFSKPDGGMRTDLTYQEYEERQYFDTACLAKEDAKPEDACR